MRHQKLAAVALLVGVGHMCSTTPAVLRGDVPFSIQGPGVNASDFRMTTFASDLNFPVGMVELSDGSVLVGVSNGSSFFGSPNSALMRLVDTDGDGVSDQRSTLYPNVPGGGLSSVRMIDDLIFTTGQGAGKPIGIFRAGATPADPLTLLGEIQIDYSGRWLHPHSALGVRATPGQEDSYDLFFQLGSRTNFDRTTVTRPLTSDIGSSGQLAGDAVHRITIVDDGANVFGSPPMQIATGLRNAAGFAFHPVTGDLYVQDNGIDGVQNANEPTSADELNVIPADQLGGDIEDFGFPATYHEYRTNTVVGNTGIQPLVAFQPLPSPNGEEGEGPNDIAFAPPGFPAALRHGIFVGMHGRFSLGGQQNEENPLVYVDLNDNSYFHFVSNDQPAVGHLDGLLSTSDSLFIADISSHGGLGTAARNSGVIYQIQSRVSDVAGDFNQNREIDVGDIDLLAAAIRAATHDPMFDVTEDNLVNASDRDEWVRVLASTYYGDADLNGEFNHQDLLTLFGIGEYEDTIANNSTWASGDFDGDTEFTSDDLLLALADGGYEMGPRVMAPVPEPGGTAWWVCWAIWMGRRCWRDARSRRAARSRPPSISPATT